MYKKIPTNQNITMLVDLYQLTMSQGYWKNGTADHEAVFHLYFRKPPFGGGYAIAAGLEYVIDYLENFKFTFDDIVYLDTIKGNDGKSLFSKGFLRYLLNLKLNVKVDAVPEGTVIFGQEPIIRVQGPILQCQLLETALLNIINFQTLIATKTSRVVTAAKGDPVLEFGARRAQGIDGALAASRAAYIGGAVATSNVLAGQLFNVPVKGTHAHSWVMSCNSEEEAFRSYAEVMPNNCTFLVDTYDTIEGVKMAIKIGKELREKGHEMQGIRLDSGDLAALSIEARKLLDENNFNDAKIVASNDLDEETIESLKQQGAQINVWGVGTNLVTGGNQSALGGVYKLAAINDGLGWRDTIKLSEQVIKVSNPGIQQVRRYKIGDRFLGDVIYNEGTDLSQGCEAVDLQNNVAIKKISPVTEGFDLLVPIMRKNYGVVYNSPSTEEIRENTRKNMMFLDEGIKRFLNPHYYFVGLESSLFDRKVDLINKYSRTL